MIRGLYNGAAALDVLNKQHELISSNLANLQTVGHRRSEIAIEQQPQKHLDTGRLHELGPMMDHEQIDFTQGRLEKTDRAMDAAISGDAFFVLDGPNGRMYTRAGRFYRDPDSGMLSNDEGIQVVGREGPIPIDADISDNDIVIGGDGKVSTGDGRELGQLLLVSFEDNSKLLPISQTVFVEGPDAEFAAKRAAVSQFHQEFSNSHPVSELAMLIMGSRQYEAVQKAASAISDALEGHIRA